MRSVWHNSHNPWEMRLVADSWMTAEASIPSCMIRTLCLTRTSDSTRQKLGSAGNIGQRPGARHGLIWGTGHCTALRLWWSRCHRGENELSRYRLLLLINHSPSSHTHTIVGNIIINSKLVFFLTKPELLGALCPNFLASHNPLC